LQLNKFQEYKNVANGNFIARPDSAAGRMWARLIHFSVPPSTQPTSAL
jgi:hypothetical protein